MTDMLSMGELLVQQIALGGYLFSEEEPVRVTTLKETAAMNLRQHRR
jgi:hypothetical protein